MINIPDIIIIPNSNKSDIINQLSRKNDIKDFIEHVTKDKYYQEELFQELFVVLLSMEEKKLIKLYKKKTLTGYISKTLNNMLKGETSKFGRKIKNKRSVTMNIQENATKDFLEVLLNQQEPDNEYQHMLIEQLEIAIGKLHIYNKKILADYMNLGFSIKKVSQKNKIHINSISECIQATKKELKKSVLAQIKIIEDQKI